MIYNQEEIAAVFKALADKKRINILFLLQDGEKCACHLLEITKMAQSALSYHMKILCESGLVICKQQGKWSHYSLSENGKNTAIDMLNNLIKQK